MKTLISGAFKGSTITLASPASVFGRLVYGTKKTWKRFVWMHVLVSLMILCTGMLWFRDSI